MYIKEIKVDKNLMEEVTYGSVEFPLQIYWDDFKHYASGVVDWHWHHDLQFSVLLRESAVATVGKEKVLLREGEGVFINRNVMHTIEPSQKEKTVTFALVFDPMIIRCGTNSLIDKKYITPYIENRALSYIHLKRDVPWQKKVLECLLDAHDAYNEGDRGYELRMRNDICAAWYEIIMNADESAVKAGKANSRDEERIRRAMEYIRAHYDENISLDDIAGEINVCRSECCRCFKRHIGMPPFEYLMRHRISVAAGILSHSDKSVQEAAIATGFNSPGYFTQLFKKYVGMSPREFRKRI